MNRITRSDLYLFLMLLLTSPVTVPCALVCLVLFGLFWLLSVLSSGSASSWLVILILGIGSPFFMVTQLSGLALHHLLRARPQIDDAGFTFHRRFRKLRILWRNIRLIREIWTPPMGTAYQFHFHEGQQLQITVTDESTLVIQQAKEIGIPFEHDSVCKARDHNESAQ
ncbi:hypothetical protein ACO0LG_16160 [Undibacterium sp. Ji42W]|uniref:hypothetical protein n=1 Tax=Undibacterium sp. Ji42W TaxID=3413039 RepID=UPI003BF17C93